jgi:conflict system STAND superfamily ATPase
MTDYRLDELGWLQFEQLCTEVLAVDDRMARDGWSGSADRRRQARSEKPLLVPGTDHRLPGPALVCVIWVGASGTSPVEGIGESVASLLVLTNAPAYAVDREQLARDLCVEEVAVLGAAELGRIVDARAELRFRLPALLSAPNLDGLIDSQARDRCGFDVADAQRLARVFVPTRAYRVALDVLARHGFAVLTGPPEMGKTSIARMLSLAAMTQGWEVHECVRPEQVWESFDTDRAQVFIADDAFGSTEYRPDAAERWARELDRILRATDERHWLIWTSRPAPLKAGLRRIHRERGAERFPAPAQVQVDASDMSEEEKVLILFRHAKAAALDHRGRELVRWHGPGIVAHRHFTPERIRRFVASRLKGLEITQGTSREDVTRQIEAEIQDPTNAMRESFHALPAEHRALLASLLDAPPGPVPERELAAAARRHAGRLGGPPGALVDRLSDHFLRVLPPSRVTWVHPSWRDLVIDELVADGEARREFLGACGFDGLMLAISTAGGAGGERELPLLVEDPDWDVFNDRLARALPEFDSGQVEQLLDGLREARSSDPVPTVLAELRATSAMVLGMLQRRWDRAPEPLSPELLESWHRLAKGLPRGDRPRPPLVEATWFELVPTMLPDFDSREEVNRFDDWLWLAEIVAEHEPQRLEDLGFPGRHSHVLSATFALYGASSSANHEKAAAWSQYHRQLLIQAMRRVMRLCPAFASDARGVIEMIPNFAAASGGEEPEPAQGPSGWYGHASVVDRVLQDL